MESVRLSGKKGLQNNPPPGDQHTFSTSYPQLMHNLVPRASDSGFGKG